jgi:peptidylprolyl isomerase
VVINTTLQDGLAYGDIKPGTGASPQQGQQVTVQYTGWLQSNGTMFDSSRLPGRQPFQFSIGGQVIQGWNEGVPTMKVGGKRRFIIPPALGYGAQGTGPIPPNATLVFDIELLSIG